MPSVINENYAFQDVGGIPIVDGYIHIGTRNQDPTLIGNKITIYSDRDLTIPLANPQRTDSYGKSINKIFIPGKYAIAVTDVDLNQQYIDLDAGDSPGTGVTRCENTQGTNDIIVDAVPTITTLLDTQLYVFRAANTNTGPMTLQIDTTPQRPIKKQHDIAMAAGDIEANQTVVVAFNENDLVFELISSPLVLAAVDFSVTGILKTTKGTNIGDTDVDVSNILTLPLDGNTYDFSGTQQVDGIATTGLVGTEVQLIHTSARQLTHHATNLILRSGANMTTAAGDISSWVEYSSGLWRMTNYHGANIAFPATQVLSADPNTLDDYEEGTWTPSLGGTATYVEQTGTYTKIGRLVYISGSLQISSIGTGSTGTISGLPFGAAKPAFIGVTVSVDIATSVVSLHGVLAGSAINLKGRTAASVSDSFISVFQNSTEFKFSGSYITT